MLRFIVTVLWAVMSAVLVFASSKEIFTGWVSAAVFVGLIGLSLWLTDTRYMKDQKSIAEKSAAIRLFFWFVLYEAVPAAVIYALAYFGLFVLPSGLVTALLMCLPSSLPMLGCYVDLSWLARQ